MQCPAYDDLRNKYLSTFLNRRDSMYMILNSRNASKQLAYFCTMLLLYVPT